MNLTEPASEHVSRVEIIRHKFKTTAVLAEVIGGVGMLLIAVAIAILVAMLWAGMGLLPILLSVFLSGVSALLIKEGLLISMAIEFNTRKTALLAEHTAKERGVVVEEV